MMRPNERTLAEIEAHRGRVFRGALTDRSTVSIHVRHGDKVGCLLRAE
jgi:hypothetical protein